MSDGQSSTVQSSSSNPSSTLSSDTPSGSSLSTDTQPTASPSVNSSTTAPSASESDDTPLLSSTAPGSSSNNSTIANTSAAQSTSATVSSTSSSLTVVADPVTSATISSGNSTSSTSTAADRLGSSLSFNAGLTPPSTVSDHPSPAHAPSQNTTPSHPASFSATAPVSTAQSDATTSRHKSHTTAIAGGIVGALVFLLLGALLFYRRPLLKRLARVHLPLRKASHTAPSAEFMNHPAVIQRRSSSALLRTASPFSYVNGAGANIAHPLGAYPYADSAEGNPFDEPPPPFTVGGFSDPIIEKASASAAAHMHMFEDRAGSSAVGASPDHYEDGEVPYDGMSEVGHAV